MSRKDRTKAVKRIVTVLMSTALVISSTGNVNFDKSGKIKKAVAQEDYEIEPDSAGKSEDYIVSVKNDAAYKYLEKSAEENDLIAEDDISEDSVLEKQNIMVLNLTSDEAVQVDSMNGVTIEKDAEMTADEVVEPDQEAIESIEDGTEVKLDQWNLSAIHLPKADTATPAAISTGAGVLNSKEHDKEAGQKEDFIGKETEENENINGWEENDPEDDFYAEKEEEEEVLYGSAASGSEISAGTDKVKIAVLDSGASYQEGVRIKERINLIDSNDVSPLFEDSNGHGTGITGLIAADENNSALKGIAPDADVYSVCVLDEKNTAPVSRVVDGIYWCIENHMDVINLSLGMQKHSAALNRAVWDAQKAGIILVAAAGNRGAEASGLDYPAAYPSVIAVGASDGNNQMTEFTSHGDGIDVLAPGEKIWTYSIMGGMIAVDGTSIAAAHVTGAVALLLERFPDADGRFLRQLIKASSVISEPEQTAGILNVENAMEMGEDFQVSDEVKPLEIDEEKVETYDTEEIVTGCWGKKAHEKTVENAIGEYPSLKKYLNIICDAASKADIDKDLKQDKRFHAQRNYVNNLHILYKIARELKREQRKLDTQASLKKFIMNVKINHNRAKKIGSVDEEKDIDEIKMTVAKYLTKRALNEKNDMKSAHVIGLASHLLGDTYAHRTVFPKNDKRIQRLIISLTKNKRIPKFKIEKYSMFKRQLKKYVIEGRDMKEYKMPTKYFEDNVNLYRERFDASIIAVSYLLTLYGRNEEFNPYRIYKVCKNESDYNLIRLNNLTGYANNAKYQKSAFIPYSTNEYRVNQNPNSEIKGCCNNERDYVLYDYVIE